jgi:hypothetical protein
MSANLLVLCHDPRIPQLFTFLDRLIIHETQGYQSTVTFFIGWVEDNPPFPFSMYAPVKIRADLVSGAIYPGPHWGHFSAFNFFHNGVYIGRMIQFVPDTPIIPIGPYIRARMPTRITW